MTLSLTFTPRPRASGVYVIDKDRKKIGIVDVTAGVAILEPIGKLFLEAELLEIADYMRLLTVRPTESARRVR